MGRLGSEGAAGAGRAGNGLGVANPETFGLIVALMCASSVPVPSTAATILPRCTVCSATGTGANWVQ